MAAAALEDPARSNPQVAQILVDWAMLQPLPDFVEVEGQDRDVPTWALGEAITNIAMVAMRDGDEDLRKRSRDWAHDIFRKRLQHPADLAAGTLKRLQFNPLAIAFAGLAFSLRDRVEERDFRELLEIASHTSSAPSHGFAVSALAIAAIDERLLKSVMRCAFRARIYCHRDWELDEEVHEAQKAAMRQKVDAGIAQEIDWIAGKRAEPHWPEFPLRNPSPRRGIRLGGKPTPPRPRRRSDDEHADSTGSAQWLEALRQVTDVAQHPWLRDLIEAYRPWTCEANGGSLEDGEEVERPPTEWNDAYFHLMATCLPGLSAAEVDSFALDPICSLPVNAFLDVSAPFLRSADVVYLDADGIDPSIAAHIRRRFADHVRQQYAWERFARDRSASVEMHMGDTISAFCFHTYSMGFAPPKCYLVPKLAAKVHPLLPVLQVLATEAPIPMAKAPVLVCEGFATGASLHEATGRTVVVTFNAGNLTKVAERLVAAFPRIRWIVAGDDDRHKAPNVGREAAGNAAQVLRGEAVFPVFPEGHHGTDFNDMAQLSGHEAVAALFAANGR